MPYIKPTALIIFFAMYLRFFLYLTLSPFGEFCVILHPVMGKLTRAWIEAVRFRTLPVSVAGVVTAVAYALADGVFQGAPALLCLLFALLCQVASNFANEYYDYRAGRDRAGREGPGRRVTEGDLTPRAMKYATFGVLGVAACVGLALTYWGGLWLIAVGALIGLFAIAYSAGPWPLSTHCMGEVAVFLFFGIIPVNFTYYVQALSWSASVLAASASIGLMGANVLIINNYRDADEDLAVGKHTLANTLGRRAMPWLYFANALAAVVLMAPGWFALPCGWLAAPLVYLVGALAITLRMARMHGHALNHLLGITAMSMFAYSLLFLLAQAA